MRALITDNENESTKLLINTFKEVIENHAPLKTRKMFPRHNFKKYEFEILLIIYKLKCISELSEC